MAKTFTIGRNGDQPFKIDAGGVSGKHAEIKIDDSGHWHVRDLNSTNGTYMRTDDGNFTRIGNKEITEDTTLRLGEGSYQSYTFMAHRVLEPDGVYGYEFVRLRMALRQQEEREAHVKATIELHKRIKLVSSLVAALILIVPLAVSYCNSNLSHDIASVGNIVRMGFMVLVPSVLNVIFSGDEKKLKDTVTMRRTLLVCPKCQQALPDFHIDNMACPFCKAK